MIDRNSNRKVAQSAKAKAKSEKALNDQVLSLVHAANETALPERHVTPRAALIVMARAMKELASLPEESRNHGVLREVTKFISLNQKTLLASVSTKHADLLPKGHPLSPLNASLTSEDLRKKYAEWIAADPAISDEARPLVAMAHSLPPESIEREHAFLRLRSLQASAVPAYFKIDDVTAITAAFSSGNSSAARRARVALQWRDRFGQWVEMGRGINFRFRLPDGSIQVARGNYVGAGSNSIVERTATGTSLTSEFGLIEVSGVPGLQPGLYPVSSSNAAVYQARIPGMEAPEEPSFKDQFDQDIPSVSDLSGARKELPIGWKKQGPYYVSDDNYAVIPGPNGQPQSVTRLNADGRPAGTVGNARNWAEANALIEKDQPEFDKEIARLEEESGELPLARIPGATEEDVVDFKDIARTQQQRAEENKKFDAQRPAPRPLSDKDLNGNVVPNAWTRDANDDKSYTREMPLRDGGTYPIIARLNDDGTYIAGHSGGWIPAEGTDGRGPSRRFESWDEIDNQGVPGLVDYLNDTFTKDNPIVRDKDAVMYYVDEDGNRVPGAAPQTEPTTPEQVKKAEQDLRRNMEKNLPPREFPQEPRDDRYDARVVTEDFVEIDKSTLDALNKKMREDSTGEYNMEGVTFAPDNYGNVVMYPDGWEPGDKIIGRIEDDGGIDWESDEQYDKYAEKVNEALRGIGNATSVESKNYKVDFDALRDEETLEQIGLDPDGDYENSEILDAWLKANSLDGRVKVKLLTDGYGGPESVLEIPEDAKADFVKAYGDFEEGVTFQDLIDDGMIEEAKGSSGPGERYTVDFETLGSSDMFEDIPGLEDEDPTEMTEQEALAKWLEGKGLDKLGVKVVSTSEDGLTKRVTFDIPTDAKDAFNEAYGLDLDENLGDGVDKVGGPGEPPSGSGPVDTSRGIWGSTNSIEKPDGKEYDIILAEMDDLWDDEKTIMQHIVDQANDLGIYVDLSPQQTGLAFGDERVVRFTFPEKTVSEELARKLIGDGPDSNEDGILMSRLSTQEDWEEALQDITGSGPDEPPSPGGGTLPKAPSPSTPGSPALFGDFDKPAGAYQLRTTEYEPEGRIDEESTDFTDDPRRLATKFSLSDLVAAFTQALIGRPNDDAMQDILDANVGDDDDLPDLADLEDVTNAPARRAGEVSGTGSGALEFNAGEEFVLAEALYNAVYEAGGDPNRVIANAYDAVNGNRNNVRKLLDAQGGVSSPEDVQLIEDMTDEIRQIKEADPDDESPAYKRSESEKKITGSLIENVPVDYDNPDYFDMDTDPYIPSVPDIDENGYTDNPRILAADYNPADLIDQMLDAITDGSGVALLDFGGDAGVAEVPAEALRDALQLLNINTNEILFNLRDESNDMSEEEAIKRLSREDIRWDAQKGLYTDVNGEVLDGDAVDAAGLDSSLVDAPDPDIRLLNPEEPPAPATEAAPGSSVEFAPFSDALADINEEDPSTSPQTVLMLDDAANALVGIFSNGMSPDVKFIAYNPNNGILLVQTAETDLEDAKVISIHPNGGAVSLESDADWFLSPGGRAYGWTELPEGVAQAIRQEVALRSPNATPAPAAPAPAAPATEAPASTFVYPGAREAGYSVNNTTLASDGSVVGAGSIVTANRDGKRGTVVSIQNDPEYVRIKFDDGKVAVRSANQIKAVSNPDGSLATAPSGSLAPSPATPSTDVESRLDAPIRPAPNVARSGAAWGINDTSEIPDNIKPLVQEGVVQSDFSAWGDRDAEIAKAATTRASFESLAAALKAVADASDSRDVQAKINADKALNEIVKDIFGSRQGVSFGSEGFSINATSVRSYVRSDAQERQSGKERYSLSIGFLVEKNGREVGDGTRSMSIEVTTDAQGNKTYEATVKNEILRIAGGNKKKGFASAYNRYMENWYIANGIEKVKVFAAGGGSWQGAFVWALNGFNWQDQYIAADVIGLLKRRARTPEEKALVEKLNQKLAASGGDLNSLPTPLEVALVGWYPGAENWLGKEVLIQKPWDGVKHLTPDAREQKQAVNYNQIKNAERRIKAGQNKPNMSANALAQVMDNAFQADNPELGPHMEAIRDALRNNRPLGFLSPAAKAALNSYVSKQLLDKDSKMPMDDLFRLRTGLDAEYRADYDFADPFGGIGEALTDFSVDDFLDNSEALQAAGFTATPLGKYESGQNTTFKVIHKQSGQVFFVKEENLSREWNGVRGLTSEVEANVVLNALGLHGIPDVRASRENLDVFIMSEAGATLPISASPVNAEKMFYDGVVNPEAGNRFFGNNGTFVDMLSNPEDILSMAIIDMLGDSEDRHDANWMVAFDNATNKLRIFPIDHGLINIDTDDDSIASFLGRNWPSAGDVYQSAIPRLIDTAGEARTKEMFLNQVDKLITNLDNPLFQPKGEELAAIIEKWGSYNAFKDAMKERLARIATPGTAENDALAKSMKRNYWKR
jgi:hypothetical protein